LTDYRGFIVLPGLNSNITTNGDFYESLNSIYGLFVQRLRNNRYEFLAEMNVGHDSSPFFAFDILNDFE